MTITTLSTAGVAALNGANANQIADELRAMAFGSFMRSMPIPLRNQVPAALAANPYVLATLQPITLPDDAKANTILRAYGRAAGSATPGDITLKTAIGAASQFTTPTGGTIAVAPSGDIVLLGTDLWTNVDVLYLPEKYDVVELILPVTTSIMTLPVSLTSLVAPLGQGVVLMMEAEALVGTVTGKCIIQAPGAAPATTKWANLNTAKSQVLFVVADAVTQARVKLGVSSAIDQNAFMEAAQNYFP
jgi:hypothetical protein